MKNFIDYHIDKLNEFAPNNDDVFNIRIVATSN